MPRCLQTEQYLSSKGKKMNVVWGFETKSFYHVTYVTFAKFFFLDSIS